MALEPSGFKIGFYLCIKVYEYPSLGVVFQMADNKNEKIEGKKASPQPQQKKDTRSEVTSIIRIAGKDVDGSLNVQRALDEVRGIGSSMSHAIAHAVETKLGIPISSQIGSLDEKQMAAINELVKNPASVGIPHYMLNRKKDHETGQNLHLTGSELLFATRQDVTREINMRSWRGFRHQYGQKVRGQHTRSTGRTGATIGVTKKAQKEAAAAAIAGEKKPAGGAGKPAAAAAPAAK
jgi:small subunit ribosomal protein S13